MAAIGSRRRGTTASRRRSSDTDVAWLGFAFADETERERERKPRGKGEELVLGLLIHARGFGLDGNGEREG